ncbi:MAG: hypothetical protein ABSC94_18225 [Polyangiaceae bacterium]|jgi:hypothetical protein
MKWVGAVFVVCATAAAGCFGAQGESAGNDAGLFQSIAVTNVTLCALKQGPVSSCDAGADSGPILLCPSNLPFCVDIGAVEPQWACCPLPADAAASEPCQSASPYVTGCY